MVDWGASGAFPMLTVLNLTSCQLSGSLPGERCPCLALPHLRALCCLLLRLSDLARKGHLLEPDVQCYKLL